MESNLAHSRTDWATKPTNILIVEDNPADVRLIKHLLKQATNFTYSLEMYDRLSTVLERYAGSEHHFDIAFLDLGLPDSQGIDTFTALHEALPHVPIVILTISDDDEIAIQAVRSGAQDYIVTGRARMNTDSLVRAIRYAIEQQATKGAALRKSEERFQKLFETSPIATILYDAEGRLIDANKAELDLVGVMDVATIKGVGVFDNPAIADTVKEQLRRGETVRFDMVYDLNAAVEQGRFKSTKSGILILDMAIAPLINPEGVIEGYVGAIVDLTERKEAEALLDLRASLLTAIFSSSVDHMFILDKDMRLLYASKSAADDLGLTTEQMIGKTLRDLGAPPALIEPVEVNFRKALTMGMATQGEIPYPGISGVREHEYIMTPIRGEEGDVELVLGMVRDITERKVAEEKVHAASLYSRSLIEASLDPLVTISAEGKITDVNKATEDVTGYSREELIGTDFSSYFIDPKKAREGYQKVFTEGFVRDYPLAIRHVSGKIADVLYNATVYRNEAGEVQGVFAAARDVTERKRAEEALRRAHNELEQIVKERTQDLQEEIEDHKVTEEELRVTTEELQTANRALEERTEELQLSNNELEQFAYIASHDLQEPLRTVTSSIGLLEKGYKDKLGEDADALITYAVDGTLQMQQLIKDLLEYSRIMSRGEKFKPVYCNYVVRQAIDNLKIAVEESGTTIRLPDKPLPMVMGDKMQLTQLFQNLIGNAIKFRSEKPPEVQIGAELDATGKRWQFSVKDNGIGMDMQYADKIFTIFQRLHTNEEYMGTGVGLALCRKIVERHGGRIWVESELGRGSTFYFTLPFYVK